MGDMIDFYLFLNSLLYKFLWEVSAPRSLWSLKTFPQDFALLTLDYGIDKWSEINVGTETFGTNNKHSPLNIASVINPVAKGWYFLSTSLLFFFSLNSKVNECSPFNKKVAPGKKSKNQ